MAIFLPRKCYTQPQGGRIVPATSAPYYASLVNAFVCVNQPYDAVSRRYLEREGSGAGDGNIAGQAGVAKRYLAVSGSSMDVGANFKTPVNSEWGSTYTILALMSTTSTTNARRYWTFGDNDSGTSYMGLRGTGSATQTGVDWSSGINTTHNTVNWYDGEPHVVCIMRASASDRRLFIDGALQDTITSSFTLNSTYTRVGFGGTNRGSAEQRAQCQIYGLLGYAGGLDDLQIKELSSPNGFWQAFHVEPTRIYSLPASGPAVPPTPVFSADGQFSGKWDFAA